MDQLNQLKIKSIFKKYDYYLSEMEWVEEYIKENEKKFNEYVYDIINNNYELRELYDSKRNELINESLIVNIESGDDDGEEEEVIIEDSKIKDPKIKSLFRKIVMETHPDRVSDANLNNIYIRVIESYDNDNLLNIYQICDELNIDYTSYIDVEYMEGEVNKLKDRILFLKNSYIYKWVGNNDSKYKNDIVLDYINSLI